MQVLGSSVVMGYWSNGYGLKLCIFSAKSYRPFKLLGDFIGEDHYNNEAQFWRCIYMYRLYTLNRSSRKSLWKAWTNSVTGEHFWACIANWRHGGRLWGRTAVVAGHQIVAGVGIGWKTGQNTWTGAKVEGVKLSQNHEPFGRKASLGSGCNSSSHASPEKHCLLRCWT